MSTSYGSTDHNVVDEEIPLLYKHDTAELSANDRRDTTLPLRILIISASVMVAGLFFVIGQTPAATSYFSGFYGTGGSSISAIGTLDTTVRQFITENEYGAVNYENMFSYPFLAKSVLVEPYRETKFSYMSPLVGCTYAWTLQAVSEPIGEFSLSGTSSDGTFYATAYKTGEYALNVVETCPDGSSGRFTQEVWVKYIRRELSNLNDNDREEFLDTFRTLWEVKTVDGQEMYGPKYRSLYFFASLHNDGGGNSICDAFHGGLGFVNNHMYLSAFAEQAMQLVNPRVALHYLEYTKLFTSTDFDAHVENQMDGGEWTEFLSDKWFGRNDPVTGRIVDSRWESSYIPTMDSQFFLDHGVSQETTFFPEENDQWLKRTEAHIHSPYGLLRSPWNYNPANYTLRYHNVNRITNGNNIDRITFDYFKGVNCLDYYHFIRDSVVGQGLSTYLYEAEDDVHGKVHFTFGGMGGDHAYEVDQLLMSEYGFTETNIVEMAQSAQKFFKTTLAIPLVNYEKTMGKTYPLTCTPNPWQNGELATTSWPAEGDGPTCTFSDYYLNDETNLDGLINLFFQNMDPTIFDLLSAMDFETRSECMRTVGSRMSFDGDMAGSGAATDPLFWVAHGAVERLLHKSVFSGALVDSIYKAPDTTKCSGHLDNSTKAWLEGFYFVDETIQAELLTNIELSQILNPSTDEYRDLINFVYDTSSFDWCAGFDDWFVADYSGPMPTMKPSELPPSVVLDRRDARK